ncbi:hypothetical protein C8R45DRAFT_1040128 [Mycena sanguinolenta]|nr:hypothetical protein C8R45DRAFT_1040128 [Mycena sanguinolenta]
MIPMGDIDLRHEIRVDECTGIVNFRRERYCARRLYSARARITGSESNITVVIYQGKGAEQAWQQDIADYMSMRHPNIIQICGAASSNGIHAMLSNDDLIPFKQYMDRYRHSHCLIIFFYACCNTDFTAVHNYIHAAFNRLLHSLECTSWIRCSTGRLCAELAASGESVWLHRWRKIPELPIIHASIPPHARFISMAIESLTIEQYQHICEMNLAQHRYFSISAPVPAAKLGSVFGCSSNYLLEDSVEIASLLKLEVHLGHWSIADGVGEVMNGDWTRFRSSDVCNTSISLIPSVSVDLSPWLSQANHIFRRLRIVSNFEHYVYHRSVTFELNILKATKKPPVGFLFLCPEHNLQTGRLTFCWPDQERAAYWSLDPTGVDRLSTEEATQLGFPPLQFTAMVTGDFWDANVYDALRRFHQAKGFDPDSQDLARHLGEPLYGVSSVIDVASARADEEGYGVDSNSGTAYASDDQSESEHSPTSAVGG